MKPWMVGDACTLANGAKNVGKFLAPEICIHMNRVRTSASAGDPGLSLNFTLKNDFSGSRISQQFLKV